MALRSALINVMVAAAQKTSRKLLRDFGELENLQVSQKGPADFVSSADKTAEDTLRRELKKARPNFGFLLEESGEIEGQDTSNRWVIDPLDGTINFLHGIPHFAISICLERDGEPYAGVVYQPVHDEMFWAEKGQGAFLNGNRLRVSGRSSLEDSIFATGIPIRGAPNHGEFMSRLLNMMNASGGIRRTGSAALDLAYVAAGRFDGYWEDRLNAWDIGAGIVLVREAGGYVTDVDGGVTMMKSGNVVAANDRLHTSFRKVLHDSGK